MVLRPVDSVDVEAQGITLERSFITRRISHNGYTSVIQTFDARGNLIEVIFFGVDGEPVLIKDGYASFTQTYDTRGNPTENAFFGVDGEPVKIKGGYASYTRTFDTRGRLTEEAFFGVDGKPVDPKDGFARVNVTRDSQGEVFIRSRWDANGNLMVLRHELVGKKHIGVSISTSSPPLRVIRALPGGPADRAGLKRDDIIISVDDQKLTTRQKLDEYLTRTDKKSVKIKYLRDNIEYSISIIPVGFRPRTRSRY